MRRSADARSASMDVMRDALNDPRDENPAGAVGVSRTSRRSSARSAPAPLRIVRRQRTSGRSVGQATARGSPRPLSPIDSRYDPAVRNVDDLVAPPLCEEADLRTGTDDHLRARAVRDDADRPAATGSV